MAVRHLPRATDPDRGAHESPEFFEIRPSPIQGMGAFALRRIRKGTRLIEYKGERITPGQADARYDDEADSQPHVLLFTVDKRTVIDAGVDGNEARFINHSCVPNCIAVIERKRVFIETRRDIESGHELTYDYNLQQDEEPDEDVQRRYACHCGSEACRGTMLEPRRGRKK